MSRFFAFCFSLPAAMCLPVFPCRQLCAFRRCTLGTIEHLCFIRQEDVLGSGGWMSYPNVRLLQAIADRLVAKG